MAERELTTTVTLQDRVSPKIKNLESSIIRFVGAVSAATAAITATFFPVAQAARFDRALRDVQKTTEFTDAEIARLGRSLQQVSTQFGQSAQELTNIAAIAGQLGLGKEGVESVNAFTEAVGLASVTLDLATADAANAGAKISNIFKINIAEIDKVFSSINEVSNNSVAAANELIDVVQRIGNIAGLTFTQTNAIAATALDLGVSAEVAGTSMVKVFSNLEAKAPQFAKLLGISVKEFSDLVKDDAVEALKLYLTKLNELSAAEATATINQLSGSGRIASLVRKLQEDAANGFGILNRNLDNSTTAFDDGTSAIREYEKIQKSLVEQTKILSNSINVLFTRLGEALVPTLIEVVKGLQEFATSEQAADIISGIAESARGMAESFRNLVDSVNLSRVSLANTINVIKIFVGLKILGVIQGLVRGVGNLAGKYLELASNIKKSTVAQRVLQSQAVVGAASFLGAVSSGTAGAFSPEVDEARSARATAIKDDLHRIELRKRLREEQERIRNELRQRNILYGRTIEHLNRAVVLNKATTAQERQLTRLVERRNAVREQLGSRLRTISALLGHNTRQANRFDQVITTSLEAIRSGVLGSIRRFRVLRVAIGATTTAAKALGVAFSVAWRAITGPIGFAIGTFLLFKDEILSFFGTVDEEEIAANDLRRRQEQQAKETADKLVSNYERAAISLAKVNSGLIKQVTPSRTAFTKDIDTSVRQFNSVFRATLTAQRGIDGAIQKSSELISRSVDAATKVSDSTVKLEELQTRRVELEKEIQDIKGRTILTQQASDNLRLKELTDQLNTVNQESTVLQSTILGAQERFDSLSATLKEVTENWTRLTEATARGREAIASALTAEDVQFLQESLKNKQAELQLKQVEKDLQEQEEELTRLRDPDRNRGRGAADGLSDKVKATEKSVEDLRKKQQELNNTIASTTTEVDKFTDKYQRDPLKEGQLSVIQNIVGSSSTLSGIETNLAILQDTLDEVGQGVLQFGNRIGRSQTEAVAKAVIAYGTLGRGIETVKRRLQDFSREFAAGESIINNATSTLNALARDLKLFREELEVTSAKRDIEIKFKTKEGDIEKALQRELKAIDRLFNPEKATTDQGRRRATAENRIRTELAKSQAQRRKDALEKLKLNQRIVASEKEVIRVQQELSNELSNENTSVSKIAALQNALKSALDTFKKLGQEAASLTGTNILGDTVGAFSSSELDEINDRFQSAGASAFAALDNSFIKLEQDILPSLTKQITASESILKSYEDQEKELTKIFGSLEQVDAVFNTIANSSTRTKDNLSAIAEVINSGDLSTLSSSNVLGAVQAINELIARAARDVVNESSINLADVIKQELQGGGGGTEIKISIKGFARSDSDLLKSLSSRKFDPVQVPLEFIVQDNRVPTLPEFLPSPISNTLIPAKASGGYISGPGTGTSDSILSWLSNGEYVIKAAAVKAYGADLFSSLNNMRLKPDMVPRFAAGGFVGSPPASSGEPSMRLDLSFNGSSIGSVRGGKSTIDNLVSALSQVSRGTAGR